MSAVTSDQSVLPRPLGVGSEFSPLPAAPRCSLASLLQSKVDPCSGRGAVPAGPHQPSQRPSGILLPLAQPQQGIWSQSHFQPQKCNSPLWPPGGSAPAQTTSTLHSGCGTSPGRSVPLRKQLQEQDTRVTWFHTSTPTVLPSAVGQAFLSGPSTGLSSSLLPPQTSVCSLNPETIFPVTQGLCRREHLISWPLHARKAKIFAKLVKTGLATSEIWGICEASLGVSVWKETLFLWRGCQGSISIFQSKKKKGSFSLEKNAVSTTSIQENVYSPSL